MFTQTKNLHLNVTFIIKGQIWIKYCEQNGDCKNVIPTLCRWLQHYAGDCFTQKYIYSRKYYESVHINTLRNLHINCL